MKAAVGGGRRPAQAHSRSPAGRQGGAAALGPRLVRRPDQGGRGGRRPLGPHCRQRQPHGQHPADTGGRGAPSDLGNRRVSRAGTRHDQRPSRRAGGADRRTADAARRISRPRAVGLDGGAARRSSSSTATSPARWPPRRTRCPARSKTRAARFMPPTCRARRPLCPPRTGSGRPSKAIDGFAGLQKAVGAHVAAMMALQRDGRQPGIPVGVHPAGQRGSGHRLDRGDRPLGHRLAAVAADGDHPGRWRPASSTLAVTETRRRDEIGHLFASVVDFRSALVDAARLREERERLEHDAEAEKAGNRPQTWPTASRTPSARWPLPSARPAYSWKARPIRCRPVPRKLPTSRRRWFAPPSSPSRARNRRRVRPRNWPRRSRRSAARSRHPARRPNRRWGWPIRPPGRCWALPRPRSISRRWWR